MTKLWIDTKPILFNENGIKKIEEKYNAKHLGYWCLKTRDGDWVNSPCELFYVENPDKEKGHSHYFAIFIRNGDVMITRGDSAFEEEIHGLIMPDGEVIVSRYRHDYVSRQHGDDFFAVDGGRDYFKYSAKQPRFCDVIMDAGRFVLTELIPEEEYHGD